MIKKIPITVNSHLQIFFAVIPLLLGITVIVGWLTRTPWAVQTLPEFVAMVLNTAVCFVITSAAILSPFVVQRHSKKIQLVTGYILIALTSLVLIETFFNLNFVDWPSFHRWLQDGNPNPGRMAPNTALGFLCCGLSLVLSNQVAHKKWAIQAVLLLSFFTVILGITGIAGYFLKLESMYNWYQYMRMAITTAIGMTMLGISMWLSWHKAHWDWKHYFGERDTQISTTAAVILIVIALSTGLASFVTLQNRIEKSLSESIEVVLHSRVDLFYSLIESRLARAALTANRVSIIRSLRKLAVNPRDADAVFLTHEVVQSFVPLGFSGLAIYDLRHREIASTGRFIDQPLLEIDLKVPYTATLQWEGGFYLRTHLKILDKGHEIGYVIAEQPLPTLTKFMFGSSGLGKTEEMGLCGLVQEKILCFPQRVNAQAYSVPHEIEGKLLPITYALNNKKGLVKTVDYRKKNVLAAYAPLNNLGLGMVLKIDTTELYNPIREQFQFLIPLLLIFIVLGSVVIRLQLKPLATQLLESEQQAHNTSKLLEQEKLHIQAIVEHVADGIITMDGNGVIESFNPAAERIFGYTAAAVLGKNFSSLMPTETNTEPQLSFKRYFDKSEIEIAKKDAIELSGQRKDGSVMQMELRMTEMQSGEKRLLVGIIRDVTERKIAEQRLAYLAQYDTLTGLANRFLFNDQLQRAMARSTRNQQLLGLMYLDIDYFKNINDEMGHDMGDALLKNFAARLKEAVRETDTVARLGGDEFTVILEGLHQTEDASLVAQKILDKMKTGFYLEEHYLFVTTSIGIAICHGNDISAELLIKKADQALYRAKEAGRNTYRHSE